jgi:hypothetical protein
MSGMEDLVLHVISFLVNMFLPHAMILRNATSCINTTLKKENMDVKIMLK